MRNKEESLFETALRPCLVCRKAHRHHQSNMMIVQHFIFFRVNERGASGFDGMHLWPAFPTFPVRQTSGSRLNIVKASHNGKWSDSPSCFTIQMEIDEKCTCKEKITPRTWRHWFWGWRKNKHWHSQGTGCTFKPSFMQRDGGSEALRKRKIVREFLTMNQGVLIIFVYS